MMLYLCSCIGQILLESQELHIQHFLQHLKSRAELRWTAIQLFAGAYPATIEGAPDLAVQNNDRLDN
jgi:hypothetical protein